MSEYSDRELLERIFNEVKEFRKEVKIRLDRLEKNTEKEKSRGLTPTHWNRAH